jgi:hypothetical protein
VVSPGCENWGHYCVKDTDTKGMFCPSTSRGHIIQTVKSGVTVDESICVPFETSLFIAHHFLVADASDVAMSRD